MANPYLPSGQRRPESQAASLAEETLNEMLRRRLGQAKESGREALSSVRQATGKAAKATGQGLEALGASALFPRAALLGGVLPAIGVASQEYAEGRPTGAAAALVGGGATAMGGRALGGMLLPGRLKPVGQLLGAVIGGTLGAPAAAGGAEYLKRQVTKEPTAGKESEFGSQLAAAEKIAELQQQIYGAGMDQYIAANKDLRQNDIDMMVQANQRLMPIAEQFQRNQMIRQQAMINTLGQNYAMLGTLATAGKLATGAQAETGATVRTALTSNPYAGSVLQAPSISFG